MWRRFDKISDENIDISDAIVAGTIVVMSDNKVFFGFVHGG